jgi:hypothetical protein
MTTGTSTTVEVDNTTTLERYLFRDGQSDVQGRLALGTPAPTVADRTTEMRSRLEALGQGKVANNSEQQKDKMARELDGLLSGR